MGVLMDLVLRCCELRKVAIFHFDALLMQLYELVHQWLQQHLHVLLFVLGAGEQRTKIHILLLGPVLLPSSTYMRPQ